MLLTAFGENERMENDSSPTFAQAFLNEWAKSFASWLITEMVTCLSLCQSKNSEIRNQNYNTIEPNSELSCNYGNLHSQYLTETTRKECTQQAWKNYLRHWLTNVSKTFTKIGLAKNFLFAEIIWHYLYIPCSCRVQGEVFPECTGKCFQSVKGNKNISRWQAKGKIRGEIQN